MTVWIKRYGAAAALAIAAALLPAAGMAEGFSSKVFEYRADDKKLAEVLQDFASSQGLPIVVDPGVSGTVNASIKARPKDFLDAMARSYSLVWYFDGTTLFVYPSSAMQSKIFGMRGYSRARVRQMLASLGLGDARFPLRFDDANQTLLAYGPPRHIELVTTVLDQLERSGRDRIGSSICVIPLRYANAADRNFGDSRTPGLATTLNELFSNRGAGAEQAAAGPLTGASGPEIANRVRTMQSMYGLRANGAGVKGGSDGAVSRSPAERANPLESGAPAQNFDAERPLFQADAATNSIIVRGLPDRMRDYEALVHKLDVVQDLVEIEATIIDVSFSDFDSLGFDWTYTGNGVQRLALSSGTPASSGQGSTLQTFTTANITTLIGGAGSQLLSRIRALQGQGKAHIVSRPRVVGVVNRTATMVDKRTASVRVAGNLDANLFQVEAGTRLQIVPQIINYEGQRDIRLTLSIRDGNFENAMVDDVPVVKETQIDTEATVAEGESLLIGGIAVDSDMDGFTGVPLFSKIPVLGALFRHRERSRSQEQRLFLLTPKIIGVGPHRNRVASAAPSASSAATPGQEPRIPATPLCLASEPGRAPNCPLQGSSP